jgi:hypothetical protein
MRAEPITVEEANELGTETFVAIVARREELKYRQGQRDVREPGKVLRRRRSSSSPVPSVNRPVFPPRRPTRASSGMGVIVSVGTAEPKAKRPKTS